MKRLLCILNGMGLGGAETFMMKIYRALDREKYQFDFCLGGSEKDFYENEIKELGGRIYRIPAKSESIRRFRESLTDVVRENKYEYVMRVTSSAMGLMDLKVAKKAGVKICAARSSNASDGKGMKAKAAHQIGKILYNRYVDVKIAPSDLAAEYTFGKRACRKGEIHYLHNALDLNVFHYDKAGRGKIRTELGISEQGHVYGHIGRFAKQKNHSFLLDVFVQIHYQDSNAVLLLIGRGELERVIKEKAEILGISNSVLFTKERSDIPRILSAMDVLIFPSLYEGMPNTVIEAQACGLPCVIADTITKEAAITDLVTYMSLDALVSEWADVAMERVNLERKDTREDLIKAKYDINVAVDEFVSMVFGEKI